MIGVWPLFAKDIYGIVNLGRSMREESRFKVGFIGIFGVGLLASLWASFLHGFRFVDSLGGVGLMLITRLFALFFWGLSAMLTLSSIVTAYTSGLASEETPYLFLQPLNHGQIALYKWVQATGYASWAFFFAVIPFIGAYAQHEHLPVTFAIWTAVFSIPLVFLCGGIGMLVCLLAARWLPQSRILWGTIVAVALIVIALELREWTASIRTESDTTIIISQLIPGVRIASHPLWPSTWASEGILAMSRGEWRRGVMLLWVLGTNVCLIAVLIEGIGGRIFFDAWHRLNGVSAVRKRRTRLAWLDWITAIWPKDIGAMMAKDIRIFLRDPGQWLQALVFFGLLALYFLNLRNFNYHLMPPEWRNLVTFLNVFSVSSVLCSLGSRFVYPQLSLEGQSFWVIGMAPTTMSRVLMAKFLGAFMGMSLVSVGLMTLAGWMLRVDYLAKIVVLSVSICVSFAISGLSTGLGAVFINLRQKNPAAIVSGFGGTLNLVLSLVFMIAAIAPYAVLFHAASLGRVDGPTLYHAMGWIGVWLIMLTAAFTLIPLVVGARHLRHREY